MLSQKSPGQFGHFEADLNCDMGEGMPTDTAIFPFISSVNIACGGHAGDEETIARTIENAQQYKVAIGAHPSYPDRRNFGRLDILETAVGKKDRPIGYADIADILKNQLYRIQLACSRSGAQLRHVKPHGAMYNRAAQDPELSDIICQTILTVDPSLFLYGQSGSEMKNGACRNGLRFVNEVFADRTYQPDGNLTPRSASNAIITDLSLAVNQALRMITEGNVMPANSAANVPVLAQTICLHGDGKDAFEFAKGIYSALSAYGIVVRAPSF